VVLTQLGEKLDFLSQEFLEKMGEAEGNESNLQKEIDSLQKSIQEMQEHNEAYLNQLKEEM